MPQRLWVCDRCKQSHPTTARRYEIMVMSESMLTQTYELCAACWDRVRAVLTNR